MTNRLAIGAVFALATVTAAGFPAHREDTSLASAMSELVDGNQRFVAGRLDHPHQSVEQRLSLVKVQHPFATVLSCSDSRVPPEVLFDTGLGDLFTIRVAGNIVDSAVLGSVEYGASHLNTPLVLVLGHTGCGAVQAALEGDEPGTHIEQLIRDIRPAVGRAGHEKGSLWENAVRENVMQSVRQLRAAKPLISERYREGRVRIVGAVYHLDSGRVEILPDGR